VLIREILTKFGFKVEDKKLDKTEEKVSSLKKGLKAAAIGVGGLYTGLIALTKSTATYADRVAKQSLALGMSAETFQELEHAADLSGASMDHMRMAWVGLTRHAGEASKGNKTSKKLFDELGISITDSEGKLKSVDVLLEESADGFKRMDDDTSRAALAMKLFGESGANLLPMLNSGTQGIRDMRKEARDLGVVSNKQAATAEAFNDSLTRVNRILRVLKTSIGFALMPVIEDLSKQFLAWWTVNKDIVKERVDVWVKRLGSVLKFVAGNLKLILGLYATFKAAKIGMGVVKFLPYLGKLWNIIKGVKIAVLLLSAKVMAVVGVLVLVGLVIEDIVTYVKGGDSLIGRFFKKYEGKKGFFGGMVKFLKGFGRLMAAIGKAVWAVLKFVWSGIVMYYSFLWGLWSKLFSALYSVVEPYISGLLDFLGYMLNYFSAWLENPKEMFFGFVDYIKNLFLWLWEEVKLSFQKFLLFIQKGVNNVKKMLNYIPGVDMEVKSDSSFVADETAANEAFRKLMGSTATMNAMVTSPPALNMNSKIEVQVNANNAGSPKEVGAAVNSGVRDALKHEVSKAERNYAAREG